MKCKKANLSSRSPSEVNRTFVLCVQQLFENCATLKELEEKGEHLKNDAIATRAEKRLLRDHYAMVRDFLIRQEQFDKEHHHVADEQG